jgi:hypothetical protein
MEGHVRLKMVFDNNSSHLCIATEQDDSGMTPPRFQADFDDSDALRNPQANRNAPQQKESLPTKPQVRTPNSQGPFSALDNTLNSGKTRRDVISEISILEILSQRQNYNLRQIEAEKFFN